MSDNIEDYETLEAFMKTNPPVWYRRLFPWLPVCYRIKELRLFIFQWWDTTTVSQNAIRWITKKHCIDIFVPAYRKWYQPPIAGFQIWY